MNNSSGFTLIELLLVTVIIGILAGMVVVNYRGRIDQASVSRAKGDIVSYGNAVELYALDHNDNLPGSLEELVSGSRKYVKELVNDPWQNPYNYTVTGDDYNITSSGKDGVSGSGDDVTATSPMGEAAETGGTSTGTSDIGI